MREECGEREREGRRFCIHNYSSSPYSVQLRAYTNAKRSLASLIRHCARSSQQHACSCGRHFCHGRLTDRPRPTAPSSHCRMHLPSLLDAVNDCEDVEAYVTTVLRCFTKTFSGGMLLCLAWLHDLFRIDKSISIKWMQIQKSRQHCH